MFRFDALKAETTKDIKTAVKTALSGKYRDKLPSDLKSPILLKPNLNSNMNALTGNTTDLRLLAGVVEFLKDSGYTSITIGEGTNSGFYRSKINVIDRLKVSDLGKHYGVNVIDLNFSETVEIEFENEVKVSVARECVESELFINMPKVKTHFEIGMSVCLKNLMGCLVGQDNKKKAHGSLAANILNINKVIKPGLHIVDGTIAMEGLGPTRGTPIKTGMIFIGDDPYVTDMMVAKFASFDFNKVKTIAEAEKRGIITSEHFRFVENFHLDRTYRFDPPKAGFLASFIHNPKRQKYFLAIRNTAFFSVLCSTQIVGKLLYLTGLRQDVFIKDEMKLDGLFVDTGKCGDCDAKCASYCPVDLDLPGALNGSGVNGCIDCLYCFCVCPNGAIEFRGTLGFMSEQMRQYEDIVKRIT